MAAFPKFWLMTSFLPPKWLNVNHFHQKWPILTKLTPLMTILNNFMSINLTEIIFINFYWKIFHHSLQIFTNGAILAPKMSQFWTFSPKITYFDQIDPINDIFNQIWPHMSKFGENGQIIFSLKVYKNYLSQVYGHNFRQKCH